MRVVMLSAFALLVLGVITGVALAQPPEPSDAPPPHMERPDGPPPPPDPENRAMLEQVLVTRLSRRLGLNDEQSVILMRRFSELREQQEALRRKRMEILHGLRGVLRLEEDEAALKRLMGALAETDKELAAGERGAREALRDMDLNIWQQAKLELFLSEFEGDMRRLVQQVHGGRPMPPGMDKDQPRPRRGPEGMMDRPRPTRPEDRQGPRHPRMPDMPTPPRRPNVEVE